MSLEDEQKAETVAKAEGEEAGSEDEIEGIDIELIEKLRRFILDKVDSPVLTKEQMKELHDAYLFKMSGGDLHMPDPCADFNPLFDFWKQSIEKSRDTYPDIGWMNHDMYHTMIRKQADLNYLDDAKKTREVINKTITWSIPTKPALYAMLEVNPRIIEIGCGLGYLAKMLQMCGADVIASDKQDYVTNHRMFMFEKSKFICGDGRDVIKTNLYHDRALLISWAHPSNTEAFTEIIDSFQGPHLFIIGERSDGCTFNIDQYMAVRHQSVMHFF